MSQPLLLRVVSRWEILALSVIARMATYIGTAVAIPVLRRTAPTTASLLAGAIAATAGGAIYVAGGRRTGSSPPTRSSGGPEEQ